MVISYRNRPVSDESKFPKPQQHILTSSCLILYFFFSPSRTFLKRTNGRWWMFWKELQKEKFMRDLFRNLFCKALCVRYRENGRSNTKAWELRAKLCAACPTCRLEAQIFSVLHLSVCSRGISVHYGRVYGDKEEVAVHDGSLPTILSQSQSQPSNWLLQRKKSVNLSSNNSKRLHLPT